MTHRGSATPLARVVFQQPVKRCSQPLSIAVLLLANSQRWGCTINGLVNKTRELRMSCICSLCGHTYSSASGSSCSNSPVKTHTYIPVSKNGYICKFCGHTSSSASGGSCSSSPHKRHEYIAKKAGNYICKFCGHTSSSASGSSCAKSPHKRHEHI